MLFLLSLADTGRIATSHTKRDTEVGGNELKNKGTLKVAHFIGCVTRWSDGLGIFTRTSLDIFRPEANSKVPLGDNSDNSTLA
jgi:hypothetical protein